MTACRPSLARSAQSAEPERWLTLDLFCGAAGGWTLGLHRAGFTTVAACEIDPWRRAVFSQNNPGARMYDDIRTLNADRLRRDLGFLPSIVCGSPPCQDASTANTQGRGIDGERTGLFFDAVRLVREVRPRWVLLENVPGLRTRGYDRVHDALEAAGYAVWPLVVGAVHAGAPHLRKRVWIVALAKSAQEQTGRAGLAWAEAEQVPANAESIRCGQTIMEYGREWAAGKSQGTAGLLILVEWMMGYPRRWLLDAALAVPALPPTATRSSRKSRKP
jgi:site-specific DNA-cytosine methylase